MSITLKQVNKKSADYKKIKELYKKAFPVNERAPFFVLSSKAKKPNVDFWGIYSDKKWAGLMYVVNEADLSYIFYFAVSETERGKGCGSGALQAAKDKYAGQKIFLSIEQLDEEAENYDQRVKRKQFYERNGFKDLNLKLKEASVTYDLLGIGGTVDAKEYERLMGKYLGKLLSKLITMKIIK
ncbi:MAG: GNAT family N-acetyltransferase [Oscillospiraceae bacterium]